MILRKDARSAYRVQGSHTFTIKALTSLTCVSIIDCAASEREKATMLPTTGVDGTESLYLSGDRMSNRIASWRARRYPFCLRDYQGLCIIPITFQGFAGLANARLAWSTGLRLLCRGGALWVQNLPSEGGQTMDVLTY